jgi:hypothetical protein
VHDRFRSAQNMTLAAIDALDDAKTGAQQSDAHHLFELLDSAEAHLEEGRRALETAAEDAAAEQSAAETWGREIGRDVAAGTRTRAPAREVGAGSSSSDPASPKAGSPQEQKVADVLKRKKGSIKSAPRCRAWSSSKSRPKTGGSTDDKNP